MVTGVKITDQELKDFVVHLALEKYGYNVFRRRALIKAVEALIKMNGDWTAEDNAVAGGKSVGSEKIEQAISHWCKQGKFIRSSQDRWRVVPSSN
jgi:hypothetical protein